MIAQTRDNDVNTGKPPDPLKMWGSREGNELISECGINELPKETNYLNLPFDILTRIYHVIPTKHHCYRYEGRR